MVDSNKATRGVLQQLLSSFGLEVEAPEDFSLAFAITVDAFDAKEPFDVILVDAVRASSVLDRSATGLTLPSLQFLPDVSCSGSPSLRWS